MNIFTILKGIAMGLAETIPGVSGGTIAFITGIYERLLEAIKAWNPKNINLLFKGEVRQFWQVIDAWFIVTLLTGMAVGIVTGVFAVTWLMEYYIEPLWGFFFGLILASVLIIMRQIHQWDALRIFLLLAGIAIAVFIISINPTEGSTEYWFVFLSGLIAISALMMPGVSGSFMLLILGMYSVIIPTFKSLLTEPSMDAFMIILVFVFGLLVGLLTFSRVLSWTFKKYHQSTLMVLTGFIIGSLYKIWPWRVPTQWMNQLNGQIEHDPTLLEKVDMEQIKVISEKLVWPGDYFIDTPKTALVIGSIIFGFLLVYFLDRIFGTKEKK
jgi:putative membrane protein